MEQENKQEKKQENKQPICGEKCNHIFVRDLIDITPDYSKEIIYCELCEFIPN